LISHQGINGHETADVLAKEGVEFRPLQSALEKQASKKQVKIYSISGKK